MFRRRRRIRRHSWPTSLPLTVNPNSRAWRVQEIQKLCNTNHYFETVFLDPASPFVGTIVRLSEVFGYTAEPIRGTDAFKHAFGERLCSVFQIETSEKFKHSFGYTRSHGPDFPYFIKQAKEYLLDKYKDGLITSFLSNWKNFNPTGKKVMAALANEFVKPNDPRAIDILRVFLRNLDAKEIPSLLQKIPNGLDNQNVKDIVKHTKTLEFLTFDEQAFLNNPTERERMVKAIGKTPSLVKRLPFKMTLTLTDLNFIAPAMRFDFVQYALQWEIKYTKWGYTGQTLKKNANYWKERRKEGRLEMPALTTEQMKELLFSVCLKKNAEFATWMEVYDKYTKALLIPSTY